MFQNIRFHSLLKAYIFFQVVGHVAKVSVAFPLFLLYIHHNEATIRVILKTKKGLIRKNCFII